MTSHVSLQIIDAALRLKNFTVSDVCFATGLKPESVYPQLARLKKAHFLTSRSLRSPTAPSAHRPLSTYSITSDPSHQQMMAERLRPLRRTLLRHDEIESDWKRAEAALVALEMTIPLISLGRPDATALIALRSQLTELYSQLENATFAIPEDLRDPANAEHPLAVAWRRWHRCNEFFVELQRRLDTHRAHKEERQRLRTRYELNDAARGTVQG